MPRESQEKVAEKVEFVKALFAKDPLTPMEEVAKKVEATFDHGLTPATITRIRRSYGFRIGPRGKVIELKREAKARGATLREMSQTEQTKSIREMIATVKEVLSKNGYIAASFLASGEVVLEKTVTVTEKIAS